MSYKIKNFLHLCIVLSLTSLILGAHVEKKNPRGSSAHPLLKQNGELGFVYKNPDKGLSLAVKHEGSDDYSEHALITGQDIFSPIVKKNGKGEVWIIWERASHERNDICCAKLYQGDIVHTDTITRGHAFHHSPDFNFDNEQNLWITWIAYLDFEYSVLAMKLATKQTWILNSPNIKSAHSPKIVVDRANDVWIFWVGIKKGRDEIFYSIFKEGQWSNPLQLNKDNVIPHLHPCVNLGPEGFPWVVWSAYDRNDYEIFSSSWNGSSWAEERITDSQHFDSHPAISFISGSVPIIVWSRSNNNGSGIYCKYKYENRWSPEKEISENSLKWNVVPKITVLGDQVGIVWQSGGEIKSEILSLVQLEAIKNQPITEKTATIPVNPSLDENAYIGFGDSITYGYIDYTPAPDLGYIPRLEPLLNENFGPSKVINEGHPGEVTERGLMRMYDVISKHKARYLLLMEGTNDVVFRRRSMDAATFHLKEMIRICREFGVFVVLTTILPREDRRWYKPFFKERIFELNDKIRVMAEEEKVPLVDMFDIFFYYPESDGGWISLLSVDKVHPSIKGYEVMKESWFEEIKILPFPPANVDAKRIRDQVQDFIQEGNVVNWEISPKLSDEQDFHAYKIYRADVSVHPLSLKQVKSLTINKSDANILGFIDFPGLKKFGYNYLDLQIEHSNHYKYAISMVREDGIEGPLSNIVRDNQ
jgi:lysophospholipase L1-like esterase